MLLVQNGQEILIDRKMITLHQRNPDGATPTLVEITVDLVKLAQKCQEIKQMIMAKLQMRMQLNKIRG